MKNSPIAVVIPAYKVKKHILGLLKKIGEEVAFIVVVDDACPEQCGSFVQENVQDPRVKVFHQPRNSGVGGATLRGFFEAQKLGAKILVKLDGDGQMDPRLIPSLVAPIQEQKADFVKGNRFFSTQVLGAMPTTRLVGNAGISVLAKISSGYWNLTDPTNGFLALHASLLPFLETNKISHRYFFENDLLFRLGLLRAKIVEMPMRARYGEEKSSLSVSHSLLSFPGKFFVRFWKRVAYRYFVRDFNIGSCFILSGLAFLLGGGGFGAWRWWISIESQVPASSGTVMLAALPVILGAQMLFFALLYDVLSVPQEPVHPFLANLVDEIGLEE